MDTEMRMGDAVKVETRSVDGVEQRFFTGTVMRFDDVGDVGGMFKEKFLPGSLSFEKIRFNVMHDKGKLLGGIPGNAKVVMGDKEIRCEIPLLDTQEHRDALTLIEAGVLRGWSLEFVAKESRFVNRVREIRKAELVGIALVDHPVYTATTVDVRDAFSAQEAQEKAAAKAKNRRLMVI